MERDLPKDFAVERRDGSTLVVDHGAWHRLLDQYVRPSVDGLNRVDYAGLRAEKVAIAAYVSQLEKTPVERLDRPEQFAFWCNLYNAVTVRVVVEHYPIASIRDIRLGGTLMASVMGGPWKAKLAKVGDIALSLDDIEHTILRGDFKDPRLHYAINCGSIGCPNLRVRPFTGAALEHDLEEAAHDFVNSGRGMTLEGDRIVLSGIFKWYRRDFGGDEAHVLRHIARYAEAERRAAIESGFRVTRYDYDWRLNGIADA